MPRIIYTFLLTSTLLTSTALLPTSSAFAQSNNSALKRYVNEEGRFEALMPANTKATKSLKGSAKNRISYRAHGEYDGAYFTLTVEEVSPVELKGDRRAGTTTAYVDFIYKRLVNDFKTDVTKKEIQQHGMKGAHFYLRVVDEGSGETIDINRRVLFDGKRTFDVKHLVIADGDSLNLATKFLDSPKPFSTAR